MCAGTRSRWLWLLLCLVYALNAIEASSGTSSPVCRGLGDVELDWWIILKYPRSYQFAYLDNRQVSLCHDSDGCWSHNQDLQQDNALQRTLLQLRRPGLAYIMYNDADPPGVEHWDRAHAKGVLGFDAESGFWVTHSAPRYPLSPDHDNFTDIAHPQTYFGQHFLCLSLSNTSMETILRHLKVAYPYIYAFSLPYNIKQRYPLAASLIEGDHYSGPVAREASFSSLGGGKWMAYSKSPNLPVTIQEYVVEPDVAASMMWETWRLGSGAMSSSCPSRGGYDSLNVLRVAFPGSDHSWGWKEDHSKWGLTRHSDPPLVCLGDLNRDVYQAHRGGGYSCVQDQNIWMAFMQIVSQVDSCAEA